MKNNLNNLVSERDSLRSRSIKDKNKIHVLNNKISRIKIYEPKLAVISRIESFRRGLLRYYTGIRCKRGHYSERYTSSSGCVECDRLNKTAPKNFVIHAPIFNINDATIFLNEILRQINISYPNVTLENIVKKEVKISSELYKFFIKAPDHMVSIIDEMSIKSIKGK